MRSRILTTVFLMIGLSSLAIGLHQGQLGEMLRLIGELLGACRAGLP